MPDYDQVWRPNRLAAPIGYLLAAGFAAFGLVVAIQAQIQGYIETSILLFCAATVALLATWRLASAPFVATSADGIVVQNPLLRRTIAWNNIHQIDGGYYRLRIRTRDGETIVAWAIQKSNVARWTHTRTRSDDVATALLAHRDRQTAPDHN